jgi:hypothetical protein
MIFFPGCDLAYINKTNDVTPIPIKNYRKKIYLIYKRKLKGQSKKMPNEKRSITPIPIKNIFFRSFLIGIGVIY